MTEKPEEEFIGVNIVSDIPYDWAMGPYSGRLFREMRDNKKLIGIRCPGCKRILFPLPEAVCGWCNTKVADDWVELRDTGTVVQYTVAGMPVFDNRTGRLKGAERPLANVKLDDGPYIMHWLEEKDPEKLKLGMRVQAVWKEQGRGRGYEDILYFRTIGESSND